MYRIIEKSHFSENVVKLVVEAPEVARARKPGHFVIVRCGEHGERIPLTIADADVKAGTITLVIQAVGVSTRKICALEAGDSLQDVVGPLGRPTAISRHEGTVLCCGGGVGVAPLLPIIKGFKEAGNRVVSVLAARNKDLIILEDEVARYSDEVIIMTDDGSAGRKGLVTAGAEEVILRENVSECVAIGPAIMMKFVALLTKKYNVPTICSLNTIMVDGTGMCGACRVTVGGRQRFVCVDGPEFDAHQVDFDEMMSRMRAYDPATSKHIKVRYFDFTTDIHTLLMSEVIKNEGRDAQWRVDLRNAMPAKERTAIPRVEMPHLDPEYRITCNEEVNSGLSEEMAVIEATRCLDCPQPTCIEGCPVNIAIPDFIKNIQRGDVAEAGAVLRRTSALPAVCGRVCPQERQCESRCIYNKMKKQPVAIGYLERYAADTCREIERSAASKPAERKSNGIRVAVAGSGPSGLSFAGSMARKGFEVDVYEALHEIGGVLKYGIPEFRLPNTVVDAELDTLRSLGVRFHTDTVIGKTLGYDDLLNMGFRGIFVASGAGLPRFMDIPGENLSGVMSSNEYLTRINLMGAGRPGSDTPVLCGENVAVIGGGNTAMDSVRTARRMGAKRAMIIYRRGMDEMPARAEEIQHAREEGVEFLTLCNPVRYEGDERGRVCRMYVQRMELGEPDSSGRRKPVPIEGAVDEIDVDQVIVSVGVSPNPLIPDNIPGLDVTSRGTIAVDENHRSSIPTIFAGGDIVRGGATVILAMGDGRKAAESMAAQLLENA